MIRPFAFSILAAAIWAPHAGAQITLSTAAGYDDNPFKLSEMFDQSEGMFLDSELRFEHRLLEHFELDARFNQLLSESDNGDESDYALTFGFDKDVSVFARPSEIEFHIRATGADASFVSRNTGQLARFGGADIPDRFDHDSLEFRARADFELNSEWTLRLQGDLRDRSYVNYETLGLSNLDYDQAFLSWRLRYQPSSRIDAQLGTAIGERVYDNRRGRALDTGFVDGTNLEFSYFNLDASWKYEFRPDHDVRIAYAYDVREDSVTGYYDTSSHRTRLRYRYMPHWGNRLAFEIEHRDFTYDNVPVALIIDDEEGVAPTDGYSFSVDYDRRIVNRRDREVWLNASMRYDDYSSPNDAFNYDRLLVRFGVEIEFNP